MLVKLKRRAKVWHDAGETVNVSPVDADFLIACGTAVPVVAEKKPDGDGKKADKKAAK